MKRRLSAAMALIGDPAVILLDEPVNYILISNEIRTPPKGKSGKTCKS